MVPEGWHIRRVGDTGRVHAGRQRSPHFTEGDRRPYLRVANVFDGRIDTSDVLTMPFTDVEFGRYRLEEGDILLNEGQSLELVGRAAIYRGDPADCCFQNTLVRYRAGSETNPVFAWNLFHHCLHTGVFAGIATRTNSIAHLGVSRFSDLELQFPPLPEQNKIAEILSTWDQAIETAEKLLANAKKQKRALMAQLLTGSRRLRGFREEWREVRLGELFQERDERGGDHLQLLSITGSRGVVPQGETDRRDNSREDRSAYKRIVEGDIGYNTMRMWQGVSALSALEGLISPAYTVLIPNADAHPKFFAQLFKLPQQIYRFRRYSQGLTSDQWNLKFKHFKEVPAYVPTEMREQAAIALVLSDAEVHSTNIAADVQYLRRGKRALMQQLMTGKLRVAA